MKTFLDMVREGRGAYASAWFDRVVASYPGDASRFFKAQTNAFSNPVGTSIKKALGELLDALVDDGDVQVKAGLLDDIIKIRAVQDFAPSVAIAFVFDLKEIIRADCAERLSEPDFRAQLFEFEQRIDQMALLALDTFVQRRERLFQIRINEVKRSVATLMKRSKFFMGEDEEVGATDPEHRH